MPNDIVRNMRLSPDWRDLPVPDWSPQQIVEGARQGVGFAYGMAREPLRASEDITRQFQEMISQPKIGRSLTAQSVEGPTVLRQGKPTDKYAKTARFGENVLGMAGDIAPGVLGAGMVRDDIVRQMKPATKATARHIKKWFKTPRLSSQNVSNYVQYLRNKGFTEESHKQLMKFVKKFHREAPDDFVDFLGSIRVHGKEGDLTMREGIRAFYQGGTRSINLPATVPGGVGAHEVKHALWDWMRDRVRQVDSRFRHDYPHLHKYMQKSDVITARMRSEWFDMAGDMASMQRKGHITKQEHTDAYRRFMGFYKKGISQEQMANTFARGWLEEGLSMKEAYRSALKVGVRTEKQQRALRNALRKEYQTWRRLALRTSEAETAAVDFKAALKGKMIDLSAEDAMRQLQRFGGKK
jgi:hypothetical protein